MRWRTPLLALLVGTAIGLGALAMHLPITDTHPPVTSAPHDDTAGCTDAGCDASHEHLLGHLGAACALIVLIAITVLPARTGRTSVFRPMQALTPSSRRHPGTTRSSPPTLSALGVLRC